MGLQESKQPYGSSSTLGTGSLRRSSLYKSGTLDEIQANHDLVRSIRGDIDIFAGSRSDERYKELQQILVKVSADLEQIKRKTSKQRTRDRCNQVLEEAQASLRQLDTKSVLNEQSERGLDLAAVESDSFINQSFNKPIQNFSKPTKPEHVRSLDEIEFQLQNLEKEVKLAIDLEDNKQFIILEKKITILYGDLVMVEIEEHTPLSDRREAFERRLISCNNQIKKSKRKLTKRLSEPSQNTVKFETKDELDRIQQRLSELEIEVVTFDGVKTDKRYKELEQTLERYWTKLYATDFFTDEERHKKDLTVAKSKEILQVLRKQAEKNERHAYLEQTLRNVEEQVGVMKQDADKFKGSSKDEEYKRLDQEARRLWASLNEIDDISESVANNKTNVILSIKNILKELSQNTKKRESQILEEVQQAQLLKQVDEFRNHWNQLNHNISENPNIESSLLINIIEILEAILDGIKRKTRALNVSENRKSNASLVVAKLTDNSDMHVIYNSAPDLVPQQLGIPEETNTKVPLQKTKVIAEMHRIGNDAKLLLEQIKHTNVTFGDKKIYENKLNQCRLNLNGLEYNKKSDTIESNRRRVTKIIEEGFKILTDKTERARSSTALEIMDVDAEIQYWRQQIKNFSGTVKDKQYERIKNGLAESLMKLQVLGDKQLSKPESIQQIQKHHQELETKLAENQAKVKCAEIKRQTSQDIRNTVEQVQLLRAQVDRFSGIYKGILYSQIEANLKSCNEKLEALDTKNDERLDSAKAQTREKIRKYLTILEDKSAKPDYPQPTDSSAQDPQRAQSQILKETPTYERVYSENLGENAQPQPKQPAATTTGSALPHHKANVLKEEPEPQSQQPTTTTDSELPHHKINALREELVVIKERVENFSGNYNDAEFIRIKNEIQDCLQRLNSINDNGHQSVVTSKLQYRDYVEKLQQYFEDKTLALVSQNQRGADEV